MTQPRRDKKLEEEYARMGFGQNGHKHTILSAKDLLNKELPPVRWAVEGILPAGVSLLGGKPKMGKSWLALGLAIAVASGGRALGKIPVEKGPALYLALEDNERRLQSRLKKLLIGGDAPEALALTTEWLRLDEGGLVNLEAWLEENPNARLVVIDTLKKIRPDYSDRRSLYDVDYEALEPLIPLAGEHNVAILVVHHLRKMLAADPLDELSGSTGLSGGVDGALILKRDRGKADAYLHVTGRDVEEEKEYALLWDANLASWALAGAAEEYRQSQERRRILDLLKRVGEPMGPKDVAIALGQSYGSVRVLLPEMVKAGLLRNPDRGKYTVNNANNTNNANNINNANNHEPPIVNSVVNASVNNERDESPIDKGFLFDVSDVSDVAPELRAYLEDPPEWLTKQLNRCRQEERYLKPTSSTVAYEVFGTASRWEEVKPVLEWWLGGGSRMIMYPPPPVTDVEMWAKVLNVLFWWEMDAEYSWLQSVRAVVEEAERERKGKAA